jgi:peroxiredoxin
MDNSYEEYYYINYLPKLFEMAKLINPLIIMPSKEEYVHTINNNKPKCMREYKQLYDKDSKFNKFANQISKESIAKFIKTNNLKIELLSTKMKETQKDKIYMLYSISKKDSKREFILQYSNVDDYNIDSIININHNTYKCKTKNNKIMNILLRWKNGNGICFPAFQIKMVKK